MWTKADRVRDELIRYTEQAFREIKDLRERIDKMQELNARKERFGSLIGKRVLGWGSVSYSGGGPENPEIGVLKSIHNDRYYVHFLCCGYKSVLNIAPLDGICDTEDEDGDP